MKGWWTGNVVVLVISLHLTAIAMLFGPRHLGYIASATFTATIIWGAVFLLPQRHIQVGVLAAVILALVVQQAAYRIWNDNLIGPWWPLAQFAGLHCLFACGLKWCRGEMRQQ